MEMHVPDIMTVEGFCDIMAVGNLCEMGKLLERPWYTGKLHPDTLEECLSGAWYYRQFQGWFCKHFTILVGETPTKGTSVFQSSLVQFVSAVQEEKYRMHEGVPPVDGCPAPRLHQEICDFISSEHEELMDCLSVMNTMPPSHLGWTGPALTFRHRQEMDTLKEVLDFDDMELFPNRKAANDPSSSEDEVSLATRSQQKKSLETLKRKYKDLGRRKWLCVDDKYY